MPNRETTLVRIELEGIEPLVWRRLRVPGLTTLAQLHDMICIAFDWNGLHLHEYRVQAVRVGDPAAEHAPEGLQDESEWLLRDLVASGIDECSYLYDPSDEWLHRVVIEPHERTTAGRAHAPLCLAGENAPPPEDVGGPGGYAEFLAALADPHHPQHAHYVQWIGGIFDPRAFDLNRINRDLHARSWN